MKRVKFIVSVIARLLLLWAVMPLVSTAYTAEKTQNPAEFYRGETVTLILPGSAGSGLDTDIRVAAKYWSQKLGATVKVVNMQQGAGMKAMNFLYRKARPDGLTMLYFSGTGILLNYLNPASAFDPTEFEYFGFATSGGRVFNVSMNGPIKTVEDLRNKKDLKLGGLSAQAGPTVSAALVLEHFNPNGKLITGYSAADLGLATGQQEVGGYCLGISTSNRFHAKGFSRPLFVMSKQRLKGYDLPSITEFVKPTAALKVNWAISVNAYYCFPPGTPKELVDYMHKIHTELYAPGQPLPEQLAQRNDFIAELITIEEGKKPIIDWVKGDLSKDYEKLKGLVWKYKKK